MGSMLIRFIDLSSGQQITCAGQKRDWNTQGLSSVVRFVLSAIPVVSFALSAIHSGEIHWLVRNLRHLFMLQAEVRCDTSRVTESRRSRPVMPGNTGLSDLPTDRSSY